MFDANELITAVKIENMSLIRKVKSLEFELFVAREQLDRTSTSKLDNMLNVQKFASDKTGLGFVKSVLSFVVTPPKFVPVVSIPKPDVRIPKEEVLATRRIRVNLSETKPKKPTHLIGKKQYKPQWFYHCCGRAGHTRPNCFKLHATKQKVSMPRAQDPMTLIHELVKALSLYTNTRVDQKSHMSRNSNFRPASKKLWMQKTQLHLVYLTWLSCYISHSFGPIFFFLGFYFSAFHLCISF